MELQISEELKQFITPLSNEEKAMLKLSLLNEGCRDPLIVWDKSDKEKILIDGHNRYRICSENEIPFNIKELQFKNKEEVKDWMIDNQLGRRNLNPDQMSYFRGLKYERLKQSKGGYQRVLSKGQNGLLTAEVLAKEFNVSDKTIKRDAQFSRGIDLIGIANPDLKLGILSGTFKVNKNDLQFIGTLDYFPKKKFKNIADLENEISRKKKQQGQTTDNLEAEERIRKNLEALDKKEELFKTQEEKLERKKAQIISAINACIRNKDKKSVKELRKVVKEFEGLVVS
tara:strand:- start:4370 stop:5224 length:855 start_codon:yes stop_codon:yes gene_type:complete